MKANNSQEYLEEIIMQYDNCQEQEVGDKILNYLQEMSTKNKEIIEINQQLIQSLIFSIKQQKEINININQNEEQVLSDELDQSSISLGLDQNQQYRWLMNEFSQYGRHVTVRDQDLLFCKFCNEYFPDHYAVLKHYEKAHHDPQEVLFCDLCKDPFIGELSLLNHKFLHHQKQMIKVKLNIKKFKNHNRQKQRLINKNDG